MSEEIEYKAWPYREAEKILEKLEKEQKSGHERKHDDVLMQTGFGPSGLPHIGTFSEVARTTWVQQALERLSDLDSRIYAFSDDMDGMRGVPLDMPNVDALIEDLGKPSIAMINGFALGGGLELALACTLRTASSTARLGLPEVSLGIIPGYGGTQRLARIAGPAVAREWVLTGDMFSAEEAHRVGVVNRIFAPEQLLEGTLKMIDTIGKGRFAQRMLSYIEGIEAPHYIKDAIKYVVERV